MLFWIVAIRMLENANYLHRLLVGFSRVSRPMFSFNFNSIHVLAERELSGNISNRVRVWAKMFRGGWNVSHALIYRPVYRVWCGVWPGGTKMLCFVKTVTVFIRRNVSRSFQPNVTGIAWSVVRCNEVNGANILGLQTFWPNKTKSYTDIHNEILLSHNGNAASGRLQNVIK